MSAKFVSRHDLLKAAGITLGADRFCIVVVT